jgi:hypothetical protein
MNQSFKVREEEKKCYNKKEFTERKLMKLLFLYCFKGSSYIESQKIEIVLHQKKDCRRRKIETKDKTDTFNGPLHI